MINFDDFKKIEMRAGKVVSAEKIPNTDKLLKLSVDFAEVEEAKNEITAENPSPITEGVVNEVGEAKVEVTKVFKPKVRQIVSGISAYFPDPQTLVGRTFMFCTNLEPRMIKGFESNGMILAVSDAEGNFSLLEPNNTIKPGTMAK